MPDTQSSRNDSQNGRKWFSAPGFWLQALSMLVVVVAAGSVLQYRVSTQEAEIKLIRADIDSLKRSSIENHNEFGQLLNEIRLWRTWHEKTLAGLENRITSSMQDRYHGIDAVRDLAVRDERIDGLKRDAARMQGCIDKLTVDLNTLQREYSALTHP